MTPTTQPQPDDSRERQSLPWATRDQQGDTKRTVAEAQRRRSGQARARGPETLSAAATQTRGGSGDSSLANTLAWHLIPGVAAAVAFFGLGPPLHSVGIPPIGALLVAVAFVLVPIQLRYLLYQGAGAPADRPSRASCSTATRCPDARTGR